MSRRVARRFPLLKYIKRLPKPWKPLIRRWIDRYKVLLLWRAERHRRRLPRVTFVAITGSTGKTMARDVVAAVLSSKGPTKRASDLENRHAYNAQLILSVRQSDGFCVVEAPTAVPGYIEPHLKMARPDIGIVTNIGSDHRAAFGTSEAIALEKGRLVEVLPPTGTAILNADDPLVMSMASRTSAKIITYGFSSDAMLRADNVRESWPDRLSFSVHYQGQRVEVQVQLLGSHWISVVLASIAAGIAVGIPLEVAARSAGSVEPSEGRMSIVQLADGVTFVRDDWKASLPSVAPAINFLQSARALQKIVVFGTISDYPGDSGRVYTRAGKLAREAADLVIFTGHSAAKGFKARRSPDDQSVLAFTKVLDASRYLEGILRPGDMVLLKGSNPADHLVRIMLNRQRTIGCWKDRCGKREFCDRCDLLYVSQKEPKKALRTISADDSADQVPENRRSASDRPDMVVVGLGNPGDQFTGTPHNVGHRVADVLAAKSSAEWEDIGEAWAARLETQAGHILVLKLRSPMNYSGVALRTLSHRLDFINTDCVLVYDDADLPLGKTRTKIAGSSGGHRGVSNIIEEFQTDQFRRVKVGVRPMDGSKATREYLLTPMSEADRSIIAAACEQAASKVWELVPERSAEVG